MTNSSPSLVLDYPQGLTGSVTERMLRLKSEMSQDMIKLATIMCAIQVCDGLMTILGVSMLGLHMEGNLILRELMYLLGHAPAIIIVKLIALLVVGMLSILSLHIRWIPSAMKGLIAIYLLCAIIPWSYILIPSLLQS